MIKGPYPWASGSPKFHAKHKFKISEVGEYTIRFQCRDSLCEIGYIVDKFKLRLQTTGRRV